MHYDPALITDRLNVNDYVEARKNEIQKLELLLGNSGSSAKKRAFQSLPRTERRRAASHDPRRVPRKKGLRKRAEFEQIRENAKKIRHKKRCPPKLPEYKLVDDSTVGIKAPPPAHNRAGLRYGHRQKDKVWLPTHVWHKKRAFMMPFAGFMIGHTATQKQFRKSHRLMTHIDESGVMLWDSSYFSTIIARNVKDSELERIFPNCSLQIYRCGSKHWQGQANGEGPAVLIWIDDNSVAIHCNPLLFDGLWVALNQNGVELEDCRYAIGCIDMIGQKKFELAFDGLKPLAVDEKIHNCWRDARDNGILPSRFIMHGLFGDPRLAANKNSRIVNRIKTSNLLYSKNTRQQSLDEQMPQSMVDYYRADTKRHESKAEIPATVFLLDDGRLRILLPRGWILPFWLTFFKKGRALIGGQLELNQLALESGVPLFPYDYPHTNSGSKFLKQFFGSLIGPKKCRLDDPSAKSPSFMFNIIKPNITYCHVLVNLEGRGVPRPGNEILNSEGVIVGVVTTGSFGLTVAKGIGIGLCNKDKLNSTYFTLKNKENHTYKCNITAITDIGKVV